MSFRRVYKKYEYAIQEYVPFEDTMRWFVHTDSLTRKEALWLFDRYTNHHKKKVRIVRRIITKWEVVKRNFPILVDTALIAFNVIKDFGVTFPTISLETSDEPINATIGLEMKSRRTARIGMIPISHARNHHINRNGFLICRPMPKGRR